MSGNENAFIQPKEFYTRAINPIGQYVDQMGFYLSTMTGKPIEACNAFVSQGIKAKAFAGVQDPIIRYFERAENGDRGKEESRLSAYIQSTVALGDVMAPTFTTYRPTTYKESILVDFVDTNVKRRSKAKKEAFAAKAAKKPALYIIKNNEQTNMKLYNNAMSGAFASAGTVLKNPTAHSTLTTITRTVSSLGNSSNEKIIAGNRHYRTPNVTFYNLISISANANREELDAVIQKYGLKYPTVDDVMACIRYSTDFYWKDERAMAGIREFAEKISPVERAAFVYGGDFYHLRKLNEGFVRTFIDRMSMKVTGVTVPEPIKVIRAADELLVNFVHQICLTECKGIGKDYEKLSEVDQNTVAATCNNVLETTNAYVDLIRAIFLTRNVPSSTAFLPNLVRRAVVLSDTDSTMFSVDEWVQWYFGKLDFTDKGFAVAGTVAYVATQSIAHILALFSANLNVTPEKLHTLAMKPEFVFPVFAQSSVAKHYFTCIAVKEGNVYSELEMEIKGVHLKNSAAPQSLVKDSHVKMREIVDKIIAGEKISLLGELKRVADIERKIRDSLLTGDTEFYKSSKIKNSEAYAVGPMESPYQHYVLWTNVFAPKYGRCEEPPYGVIKIPTIVNNKTELAKWLADIKDRELAERFGKWLVDHKKTSLPTMYLSSMFVKAFGIPEEIKAVIDFKRIILDLTTTDRMILETLGYFPKTTMLIGEIGY